MLVQRLLLCRTLSAPNTTITRVSRRLHLSDIRSFSAVVPVADAPTFEEFQSRIFLRPTPCLLQNCISHWPALKRWADVANLKGTEASNKLVPIEVARIPAGQSAAQGYNSRGAPGSTWDRLEMPLDAFLGSLMSEPEAAMDTDRWAAYLAQYALLDEAPALRADVSPPLPYTKAGRGDDWPVNMWIGTAGTYTPIHKDPYHNLFCQIIGKKRVHVFPPSAEDNLYISSDPLQRNTTRIPTPEPDLSIYPRFRDALAHSWQVDVGPGEVLFIPRGFFHSVQSLTKSISVNSWFM